MLLQLMNGIAILFYWTWPVWPFVFVFSLAQGIAEAVKETLAAQSDQSAPRAGSNGEAVKSLLIAGGCLLVMLCAVIAPSLS